MGIGLLSGLLFKHFVADYILQNSFQYKNKGIYGHRGGLLHAGIHLLGTALVLIIFVPLPLAAILALADGVIHYHIDWVKEKLFKHFQLVAGIGHRYWFLFGLDQFLHQMTYVGLVWVAGILAGVN